MGGHGYLAVLGYGIIVDIADFIEKFPDFAQYIRENNIVEVRDYLIEHNVSIHYDAADICRRYQEYPEEIFITQEDPPMVDARRADTEVIDLNKLERGREAVEAFRERFFPHMKLQLHLYSYEDG